VPRQPNLRAFRPFRRAPLSARGGLFIPFFDPTPSQRGGGYENQSPLPALTQSALWFFSLLFSICFGDRARRLAGARRGRILMINDCSQSAALEGIAESALGIIGYFRIRGSK